MRSCRLFVRFITRKWPPAVGGMETYSVRLAEKLPEYCEVDVVALPGRKNGDAPKAISLALFGLRLFVGLAFSRRPADVTHIGDLASWPLGLAAKLRRPTSTIVLSAHGTDVSFALRSGLKHRIYFGYLCACNAALPGAKVIANSSTTASALSKLGFNDTTIVPLAADAFPEEPAEEVSQNLLFAGRLLPQKGLLWFVQNVLDRLPRQIGLNVAGPIWDKAEARCLQHERVTYLGVLPQNILRKAYRQAQCVIIPNLNMETGYLEGFGLVAPEAAAAGAVVLGAATGGLTDAILDGETGFLLPPGDADAWAEKISEIMSWDAKSRQSFVTSSQKSCWKYYSWERVARDTFKAYGL